MDIRVGFLDIIKLAGKFVSHKLLQYRLRTYMTHILELQDGRIQGVQRQTVYDDTYWAFEGVPYGKPPIGELRFRAPQPVEPWEGIKNCTSFASKPVQKQIVLPIVEGSEDCLYMNVYVKKLESERPLPVMVWIYGGGFQVGEASRDIYAPDYFMQKDIVLVCIAYRVGVLGFLSLEDPDLQVPGNAGLKDQVLALQWIKKNIASFNGDADNITIFGESAGGSSVHFMMLCERTEGLFHKAIMQSGTALCPWAKQTHKNWGFRLAQELGYKGENNDKEVFRYLSKQEPSKLVVADSRLFNDEELGHFMVFVFGPVVEPYVTEDAVLTKEPLELMRTTWSNRIPVIIGFCSLEGLFSYQTDKRLLENLNDCIRLLPDEVRQSVSETKAHEMGLKLRKEHFGEADPSAPESFFKFLDLMSYKNFVHSIYRVYQSRMAHVTTKNASTYLYRFDMDSPTFNLFRILVCGPSVRGVAHADDLSYLFYSLASWKLPTDSAEYRTIQRMIAMWTSFAEKSDPNCSQILPTVWEVGSRVDILPKCLNISNNVEFINIPELPKLGTWDSLYEKLELI